MTVQVALIGAGGIGGVHSNAYEQVPGAHICAVVDIRREFAEKLANVHHANVYTSVSEMLAGEKPEMVDICTPSYTHPDIAIQCSLHGLHVLVEKPMAFTLSSAREMIDSAQQSHKLLMVAQVIRFWPEYFYLKQIYDSGMYGGLLQAWFSRISSAPLWSWENWYVDPARSGLAPFDLHIHDTDYLHYLLGKPDQVLSLAVNRPDIYASFLKTRYFYYSHPEVIVEAEAGWWHGSVPFMATFRVVFERAVVVYDNEKLTIYETGGEPKIVDLTAQVQMGSAINLSNTSGIYNEIAYFVDCIQTGTAPNVITPEQSFITLKLLLTELESARTGAVLDI
jgi:predicted dehydrogenase